jgi:hypothetical protein
MADIGRDALRVSLPENPYRTSIIGSGRTLPGPPVEFSNPVGAAKYRARNPYKMGFLAFSYPEVLPKFYLLNK